MYFNGTHISKTSAMHFSKLIFRSFLFVLCTILYIVHRVRYGTGGFGILESDEYFVWGVSTIFIIEMCFRFFPSQMESKGCQKQFSENYIPTTTEEKPKIDSAIRTVIVILSWVVLNAIIAALYFIGIIDQEILILVCLIYSICDMICILFFCPFQTWMMKNKCCGTCRIYNWDFIMMFTPCILIDHVMAKILFILAALLLVQWEVIYKLHPERFAENTNAFLQCDNCTEKLCSHKKQLQKFLVDFRNKLKEDKEKIEEKL